MNKKQTEQALTSIRGWDSESQKKEILRKYARSLGYTQDITGDACQGDTIIFARATFTGNHRKPRYNGDEIITGTIIKDSYGARSGQHTFTIKARGLGNILIKGRNLYRIAVFAKPRQESDRTSSLDEKHQRGDANKQRQQAIRQARQNDI